MPPAVWVPAAAGIAGGLINNNAQRNASRTQQRANDQAIQLEREKMAAAERDKQAQQAAYSQWYRQQMDIRRQIAKRYGIDIPDYANPAAGGGKVAGAPAAGTQPVPTGGTATPQSFALTLGNIMGKSPTNIGEASPEGPVAGGMSPTPTAPPATQGAPGQTLGDMLGPNWSDWRNQTYG